MPAQERRTLVLTFLDEQDIALPPTAIYAGLRRKKDITFGYRTVQAALSDLMDDGYVIRVDSQQLRDDGTIQPLDGGDGRRAHYFITDKGRERVRG